MRTLVAVACLALLSGCLGDAAGDGEGRAAGAPRWFVQPGEPSTLEGCAQDCDRDLSLGVEVPAGFGGWLEVRVRWDGSQVADLGLRVTPPHGEAVSGERGFDDRVARIHDVEAGTYRVEVTGEGAHALDARLGTLDLPEDGPLLPNLVELVIEGPKVGPCDEVERTEQGAVTCMRFGNGVGNPGDGPVQIRLSMQEGALALLPMDGRFVQEVRHADGSVEGHEVGPAAFHPTHAHWHYDGFALFELFHHDEATGLRGGLAVSHHKSGFCFLDWDTMPENVTEPADQERAETDCLVPGMGLVSSPEAPDGPPAWTNGISRGWYDFYEPVLTDQYVDIAGLPKGTYELVATADPADTLDETDETDNQSSLLLSIDGEDIRVLEERAHYRVQDEDDWP